jgi:hypothetical protein
MDLVATMVLVSQRILPARIPQTYATSVLHRADAVQLMVRGIEASSTGWLRKSIMSGVGQVHRTG